MPRNRQIVRQWRLLRTLHGRYGHSLPELASALGVTDRTVRRDLEALEEAGFPLCHEPERRWRLFDWRNDAI